MNVPPLEQRHERSESVFTHPPESRKDDNVKFNFEKLYFLCYKPGN